MTEVAFAFCLVTFVLSPPVRLYGCRGARSQTRGRNQQPMLRQSGDIHMVGNKAGGKEIGQQVKRSQMEVARMDMVW